MDKKTIPNSYTIEAKFIGENSKAWYLDCEGDCEWFPKSQVNFDKEKNELEAPEWLLKQKFKDFK